MDLRFFTPIAYDIDTKTGLLEEIDNFFSCGPAVHVMHSENGIHSIQWESPENAHPTPALLVAKKVFLACACVFTVIPLFFIGLKCYFRATHIQGETQGERLKRQNPPAPVSPRVSKSSPSSSDTATTRTLVPNSQSNVKEYAPLTISTFDTPNLTHIQNNESTKQITALRASSASLRPAAKNPSVVPAPLSITPSADLRKAKNNAPEIHNEEINISNNKIQNSINTNLVPIWPSIIFDVHKKILTDTASSTIVPERELPSSIDEDTLCDASLVAYKFRTDPLSKKKCLRYLASNKCWFYFLENGDRHDVIIRRILPLARKGEPLAMLVLGQYLLMNQGIKDRKLTYYSEMLLNQAHQRGSTSVAAQAATNLGKLYHFQEQFNESRLYLEYANGQGYSLESVLLSDLRDMLATLHDPDATKELKYLACQKAASNYDGLTCYYIAHFLATGIYTDSGAEVLPPDLEQAQEYYTIAINEPYDLETLKIATLEKTLVDLKLSQKQNL